MARTTKAIKSPKAATSVRKPARSLSAAADKPRKPIASKRSTAIAAPNRNRKPGRPAKATVSVSALPKTTKITKIAARSPPVSPVPKISKEELRAQVEKLGQLVASFRAKSRETAKLAKVAMARIAELEAYVARLEKKVAAAGFHQPRPTQPSRAKAQSREIDPGDAVPPGVAVQESGPLDAEAEAARESLEEHLGRA